MVLTSVEARVLGALVEKEVTTPEYYPLSLNALINACNQRSNREPVMALDEEAVRQALHRLEDLRLAGRARSTDGRVAKYEHWLGEVFNFSRAETALVCVLLLRGPQTPGYAHLLSGGVETIASAVVADPAFPRREAGQGAGPISGAEAGHEDAGHEERIAHLESTVAELRQQMDALRQKIDDLFGD